MEPTDIQSVLKPIMGRVLVRQIPYKPSRIVQLITIDKANENEGIVVALSPCQHLRKMKRDDKGRNVGYDLTGATIPHELKVGDRVIFPGSYQDDDVQFINGEKHRWLVAQDILGIIDVQQPEGFENAITGEKSSDHHPILSV